MESRASLIPDSMGEVRTLLHVLNDVVLCHCVLLMVPVRGSAYVVLGGSLEEWRNGGKDV